MPSDTPESSDSGSVVKVINGATNGAVNGAAANGKTNNATCNCHKKAAPRQKWRFVDLFIGRWGKAPPAAEEDSSDSADKSGSDDEDSKDKKKDGKPEDQTMKTEIKHLDRKYDDKDERYFVERTTDVEKPEQKDWWQLYAFCLVRHYDSDDDLEETYLYVNPQPLRQLLKDVIGDYPSDPIDVDDVQIEAPYHSLFYYRKELEAEGMERFKDEPTSMGQFQMLLDWIKKHFETEIAAHEKCLSGELRAINYDRLWTLFRPGTIAYSKVLNEHRAFRIRDNYYDDDEMEPGLQLNVEFIDFDGTRLGTRRSCLMIPQYAGTVALTELNVVPLHLFDDADEIRAELISRGRKFEAHAGQHYTQYSGVGIKRNPQTNGYDKFNVAGRVMVDCKTYHRLDPNDSFAVKELPTDEAAHKERERRKAAGHHVFTPDGPVEFAKLSDENAMLTNATVRGYAFSAKRFLELYVERLKPIEWNPSCFDDLVLDPATKRTVQALVSTHANKRDGFDDIVKGKGQGLVCVLHGPPGVGKTLTAECVAEYVKKPLYMVSSGDLGVSSEELDRHLSRIMDMTATWGAVLLIDEADIFLERRSLHDLHRNAMVSVFLRVLEYYTGILFLTTNRVATFDDAFRSRIHIPIRYTDLDLASRKQIWRNFCARVPGGVDITERGLERLADHELNGRQIKNIVKTAESLARFEGKKLDLEQLEQVTKIQATFEKDLLNVAGVDYTAPGATRKEVEARNMFL